MAEKRFGVLLCADDSERVKKQYGGYFGVFVKMFGEEGEKWDLFRVAKGEIPGDDEIAKYDGFVITGSCNDAHGNDDWICKLLVLLRKLNSLKIKVLGICFGHQILCRALGGKTGRSETGWDIGVRTIHLSATSSSKLYSSVQMPALLPIIQCHRDEVKELPHKAKLIGWSTKTPVEMFTYEDHIMGIQGHPEYTNDILYHLIDRLLSCNLIKESDAKEAKANVEKCELDREAWRKLCICFLKG